MTEIKYPKPGGTKIMNPQKEEKVKEPKKSTGGK